MKDLILERDFQNKVKDDLDKLDKCYYIKIQTALNGTPDLAICINGWSVHIELKRDKSRKPEKLQEFILKKIRRSGSFTFLAHPQNWGQIYKFLIFLDNTSPDNLRKVNNDYSQLRQN